MREFDRAQTLTIGFDLEITPMDRLLIYGHQSGYSTLVVCITEIKEILINLHYLYHCLGKCLLFTFRQFLSIYMGNYTCHMVVYYFQFFSSLLYRSLYNV